MPTYILLSTLTVQGVQTLKSNPERLRAVNQDVEELGCKVLHQWATLGEFDFVNIVEAPDEATIARVSVALGARGSTTIRTRTAAANEGSKPSSIIAFPFSCAYGTSGAPPLIVSKNCRGSKPSARASEIVSASVPSSPTSHVLRTSFMRVPAPASPSHIVSLPITSNIGLHFARASCGPEASTRDRKSTRLNSSHVRISYAVFCLKKKKKL